MHYLHNRLKLIYNFNFPSFVGPLCPSGLLKKEQEKGTRLIRPSRLPGVYAPLRGASRNWRAAENLASPQTSPASYSVNCCDAQQDRMGLALFIVVAILRSRAVKNLPK